MRIQIHIKSPNCSIPLITSNPPSLYVRHRLLNRARDTDSDLRMEVQQRGRNDALGISRTFIKSLNSINFMINRGAPIETFGHNVKCGKHQKQYRDRVFTNKTCTPLTSNGLAWRHAEPAQHLKTVKTGGVDSDSDSWFQKTQYDNLIE